MLLSSQPKMGGLLNQNAPIKLISPRNTILCNYKQEFVFFPFVLLFHDNDEDIIHT